MVTSYSERLGSYSNQMQFSHAPLPVQEKLRACLLYNLSLGMAESAGNDELKLLLKNIASAEGSAGLFASTESRSAADAAFMNAATIAMRGQNDTHPEVVTHIGCVVLPAVMAVAQVRSSLANDILSGLLAGYEVTPKVARQVSTLVSQRGFRPTPVFSVIGAAVAVSRLLRLSSQQTANAIAIATNFSGGLLQCWDESTPEWIVQVAHASRSGVIAALLAEGNMSGARFSLEGESGFYRAFSDTAPPLELKGWDILDVTFKPYPGCAFNQTPVFALKQLVAREGLKAKDIEKVKVHMAEKDASYPGVTSYGPFSGVGGAVMSAPFMLAATLKDGAPTWSHFQNDFSSGDLHDLSQVFSIIKSKEIARWQCVIEVFTYSGDKYEWSIKGGSHFIFNYKETVGLIKSFNEEQDFFNLISSFIQNIKSDPDSDSDFSVIYNLLKLNNN